MVKPKTDIHKHFTQCPENGKMFVSCKYCKAKYIQHATKMKHHISNLCKSAPEGVKYDFKSSSTKKSTNSTTTSKDFDQSDEFAHIETIEIDCETETNDPAAPAITNIGSESSLTSSSSVMTQGDTEWRSKSMQYQIGTYIDTIKEQEQEKIWRALAKAVYVSGLPLSIFEEPHWIEAFQLIRPALKLPSRYQLSNPLLDDQFENTKFEVEQKIMESQSLSLQCDGWTNNKSEAITNFIISTPEPLLVKSVHSGTNNHSTEYLFEEVCKVIDEFGPRKFAAFVSDNSSNVKGTWSLIEYKYSNITAFGCAAHGLNLLVDDILTLQSAKTLLLNVKSIITKIRKSTLLKAQFEKVQMEEDQNSPVKSVHLPVKTRWSTFVKSLNSILATKQSLRRLAIDEVCSKILEETNCLNILSNNFWDSVETFRSILAPIAKWLKQLEYDSMRTMSLVPRIFFDLQLTLENVMENCDLPQEVKATILSMLEERKTFSRKPIHLAANLLDPREKGMCLTATEELEATEYISNFASTRGYDETEVLTELANYKMKSGVFAKDFVWKIRDTVSGPVWWGNIPQSKLGECATIILNISSTSVDTERSFSTFASIQTNSRNRLLKDRCNKLVYLAHNLRGQRRKRREFVRDEEQDEAFRELRAVKEGLPNSSSGRSKHHFSYNLRDNYPIQASDSDESEEDDSEIDSSENDADYEIGGEEMEFNNSCNSESESDTQ